MIGRDMCPSWECRICNRSWDKHYDQLVWRLSFERAVALGQGDIVARLLKKSF